jgi:lipocalin-like protein
MGTRSRPVAFVLAPLLMLAPACSSSSGASSTDGGDAATMVDGGDESTGSSGGSGSGASSGGSGSSSGGSSGSSSGGSSGAGSGSSSGVDSGTSTGSSSGSADSGSLPSEDASSSDASACGTFGPPATPATVLVSDAGAPGSWSGGSIASGTYYLTSITSYGGAACTPGYTAEVTWNFSAASTTSGTYTIVSNGYNGSHQGMIVTQSGTYAISGSSLSYTAQSATCSVPAGLPPDAGSVSQVSFTAGVSTISYLGNFCGGSEGSVQVLTKQ